MDIFELLIVAGGSIMALIGLVAIAAMLIFPPLTRPADPDPETQDDFTLAMRRKMARDQEWGL